MGISQNFGVLILSFPADVCVPSTGCTGETQRDELCRVLHQPALVDFGEPELAFDPPKNGGAP